jgi:hypothetical protein
LGEDVSGDYDELLDKYEEALVIREFEVGVMLEAITKAFSGGKKR